MNIKSFRGQLADGQIKRIRLSTKQGLTGYKIVKFQIIEETPGVGNTESLVQVYTQDPGAVAGTINFENPLLLAVGFWNTNASSAQFTDIVIFESAKFNQDIYIAHSDLSTTGTDETINYYLELEQVKLSQDEATVATLKDMRGRE